MPDCFAHSHNRDHDQSGAGGMVDPFGRTVSYVRVSVTDRCDFRCVYCMPEKMTFLPKPDLLSLEELDRLCSVFIAKGVTRLRLTGGEPLVRKNVMWLFRRLGRHIETGALQELTLTTNGSRLADFSQPLFDAGVRRVNVSLDTLDADTFKTITRRGDMSKVLDGLEAARAAGLGVKINIVALKGVNDHEIDAMIRFCGDRGHDLTLIETMPMGDTGTDRLDHYLPLSAVRDDLESRWTLDNIPWRTGGPARYVQIAETGGRLGFITPLTHNFCESCNRVRLTCTGRLYLCLGQNDYADLREVLRGSNDDKALHAAIDAAIGQKPKGHDFVMDRKTNTPAITRHMNVTGG